MHMEIQTSSQKPTPRGLRNRNPLNIEKSSTTWLGQCGSDSRFCVFLTNQYGYRAAFRIMYTYRHKYNLFSIRQIISRWAPSSENNTDAYINRVCKLMNAAPTMCLCFGSEWNEDKHWCCQLVHAMACVENGVDWDDIKHSEIEEGYEMAFHEIHRN